MQLTVIKAGGRVWEDLLGGRLCRTTSARRGFPSYMTPGGPGVP